jgi:hypothetical protein
MLAQLALIAPFVSNEIHPWNFAECNYYSGATECPSWAYFVSDLLRFLFYLVLPIAIGAVIAPSMDKNIRRIVITLGILPAILLVSIQIALEPRYTHYFDVGYSSYDWALLMVVAISAGILIAKAIIDSVRKFFAEDRGQITCVHLANYATMTCEVHPNSLECPDILINYSPQYDEYSLPVRDGGLASVKINFCPWCGASAPESKRDRWFDELAELGFDEPHQQKIPPQFQNDAWWKE